MSVCFFFNDTATTEIYTLSLHDALPISWRRARRPSARSGSSRSFLTTWAAAVSWSTSPRTRTSAARSEEHTSELQSRQYLVCRLLLEKKKKLRSNSQTPLGDVSVRAQHA